MTRRFIQYPEGTGATFTPPPVPDTSTEWQPKSNQPYKTVLPGLLVALQVAFLIDPSALNAGPQLEGQFQPQPLIEQPYFDKTLATAQQVAFRVDPVTLGDSPQLEGQFHYHPLTEQPFFPRVLATAQRPEFTGDLSTNPQFGGQLHFHPSIEQPYFYKTPQNLGGLVKAPEADSAAPADTSFEWWKQTNEPVLRPGLGTEQQKALFIDPVALNQGPQLEGSRQYYPPQSQPFFAKTLKTAQQRALFVDPNALNQGPQREGQFHYHPLIDQPYFDKTPQNFGGLVRAPEVGIVPDVSIEWFRQTEEPYFPKVLFTAQQQFFVDNLTGRGDATQAENTYFADVDRRVKPGLQGDSSLSTSLIGDVRSEPSLIATVTIGDT